MIHIVLYEPEIPQNTGNIARTCAAIGARLHLIEPLGFSIDDKHVKRAGMDYWQDVAVKTYKNLDDFFKENPGQYIYATTKGSKTYADISYSDNCYIIFGKESAGLPEELLRKNPETAVRIPMLHDKRSLNLSNAAAIMAYEALRQLDFPGLQNQGYLPPGNKD